MNQNLVQSLIRHVRIWIIIVVAIHHDSFRCRIGGVSDFLELLKWRSPSLLSNRCIKDSGGFVKFEFFHLSHHMRAFLR